MILIAVNSCAKDKLNGSNEAIRKTWGAELPKNFRLRFFIGGRDWKPEDDKYLTSQDWIGSPGTLGVMHSSKKAPCPILMDKDMLPDEVLLPDCPDGYLGLPWKTVQSLEWALDHSYRGVLRAFVDTYFFAERLSRADFSGRAYGWTFGCGPCPAHPDSHHLCPMGGAGYYTDRVALEAIIKEPIRHWGEDTHAGYALHNAGISIIDDSRFRFERHGLQCFNKTKLSRHLNDRGFKWDPSQMYAAHKEAKTFADTRWPWWDGYCPNCGRTDFKLDLWGPKCVHCGTVVMKGKRCQSQIKNPALVKESW